MGTSRNYMRAARPPQQTFSANRFSSANRLGLASQLNSQINSRNRSNFGNRFGAGNRFGNRGGRRSRGRDRGFRGPWRNGYPGWYGYYDPYLYDPYWLGDSFSGDDQYNDQDDDQDPDMAPANDPPANAMNAQGYDGPGPEDQRARDGYDGSGDQDIYARSAPYGPRNSEITAPSAPTTLVFRDLHKEEIQNYAIVGNTLWNFSAQRTQKIPLSDLDIPATTKINDDRGVNFRVPGEGQ